MAIGQRETPYFELSHKMSLAVFTLMAIVATTFCETTPSTTEHLAEIEPQNLNYFYDPAHFLQVCAQFPELAACQQVGSLVEKRKSAYMRFGRAAPDAVVEVENEPMMDKRKSAYMRFGKRSTNANVMLEEELNNEQEHDMAKRKSAYMRFGKRKSAYMRFGKRSSDDAGEMEKRKSAYMRFGKRSVPSENAPEMEKRKSAYMRFGKRR